MGACFSCPDGPDELKPSSGSGSTSHASSTERAIDGRLLDAQKGRTRRPSLSETLIEDAAKVHAKIVTGFEKSMYRHMMAGGMSTMIMGDMVQPAVRYRR